MNIVCPHQNSLLDDEDESYSRNILDNDLLFTKYIR